MSSRKYESSQSEFDDLSTQGENEAKKDQESRHHVARLAMKETQNVRMWRRNVFLMLLATATLVTTLTFLFLRDEDSEDFSTSFDKFASTIRDATEFNLLGVVESTDGLSEVLTSEAIKTNSEWPFVTLSSFEVFVRHTRAQASSELIVVAPIVTAENLEEWANYSTLNQAWIDESFDAHRDEMRDDLSPIPSKVYRFGRYKGRTVLKPEDGAGGYPTAPFWQMSPPPFDTSIVNFNSLSTEVYQDMYDAVLRRHRWTMGMAGPNTLIDYTIAQEHHDALHSESSQLVQEEQERSSGGSNSTENVSGFANEHPHTAMMYPVYRELNNRDSDIVAMVVNILPWDNYLKNALPPGVNGVYCVLRNSMGQAFTYIINGNEASYLGEGDMHDRKYDDMEVIIDFNDFFEINDGAGVVVNDDSGSAGDYRYWFAVYPSEEMESVYQSNTPMTFALVTCSAFVVMTLTFILYDWFVIRKNNKILEAATRSDAILSSLFPQEIKNRLLEEKMEAEKANKANGFTFATGEDNLKKFLNGGDDDVDDDMFQTRPIAELFPDTTVLFADLVGFTAWSSTREPASVFVLLETLFRAFDKIARRRMVYKVETIGDCYLAITGLPEPRPDHAVVMVRFAKEISNKMLELTGKLEEALGPDTATLQIRIGLHSGPVTAGVLRGERSRFQLFGDTVNTASRMESTGEAGRIHMSQETADLLVEANKGQWVEKRTDVVIAKGKGELQTYWLTMAQSGGYAGSVGSLGESSTSIAMAPQISEAQMNEKMQRLIQWNVKRFAALLKEVAARRGGRNRVDVEDESSISTAATSTSFGLPFEEVKEVIDLSSTSAPSQGTVLNIQDVDLDPEVSAQLEEYISLIASMYMRNSFHNFEHASHVIQSVLKLMSRFQSPRNDDGTSDKETIDVYSFSADPLTQFACAFSALIHDVNHPGVPNARLMMEDPEVRDHYKGRSVAEQRSFDIAWELLQEDKFVQLRMAIYINRAEEVKFRQLVVNSVMSTDIFDKDLKQLRNDRWDRAFGKNTETDVTRAIDRKATIVIEHLIQASDVAHTMQHWTVYCRWNERLYVEMYQAYLDGRSDKDPTDSWYDGEIWFFDNYVIPLAKRLKECGVYLGVSGDEYLDFATKNRKEWEKKGRTIVADMKDRAPTTESAER